MKKQSSNLLMIMMMMMMMEEIMMVIIKDVNIGRYDKLEISLILDRIDRIGFVSANT